MKDILLRHRNTPHCTTGKSPAQLFLNRKLRMVLDIMNSVAVAKTDQRKKQKKYFDRNTKRRVFVPHQLVSVEDFRANKFNVWAPGKLLKPIEIAKWSVLEDGQIWRRHAN